MCFIHISKPDKATAACFDVHMMYCNVIARERQMVYVSIIRRATIQPSMRMREGNCCLIQTNYRLAIMDRGGKHYCTIRVRKCDLKRRPVLARLTTKCSSATGSDTYDAA